MNSIIQYIFEVTLGSSLLFLGFYLVKNFLPFRFKRFYLLGCIALPLVFPLISFDNAEPIITQVPSQVSQVFIETAPQISLDMTSSDLGEVPEQKTTLVKEADSTINWKYVFILLYGLISLVLLVRFTISLLTIYQLSKNPVGEEDGKKFFLIRNQNFTGGSFFHFIFINERYLNNPAFKTILSHEHAHLRLFHSLDIVLSELFCVCFWINPTAWILKKEIRLNAEYEADLVSAKSFGEEHYANTLLNLSITSHNIGPMLSFSAMDTRRRLKNILNIKQTRWFTSLMLLPFLLAAAWLISCEPEMMDFAAMDPQAAMKNVKKITTTYTSHQNDTENKDGRIISIAYFLPNGEFDYIDQFTSYPYSGVREKPLKINLMSNPLPVGVTHILDGLTLDKAELNFLYGNDWPKKYINEHPFSLSESEFYSYEFNYSLNSDQLPETITISQSFKMDIFHGRLKQIKAGHKNTLFHQKFTYENGRIKTFDSGPNSNIEPKTISKQNPRGVLAANNTFNGFEFQYEGDLLTEINRNGRKYRFYYEGNILTKSEYEINGKLYQIRKYFYEEDGLKKRTEMYNVNGDPEYTINYDYEYF